MYFILKRVIKFKIQAITFNGDMNGLFLDGWKEIVIYAFKIN